MPTLKDFIARVVPWPGANTPGVVNVHWRMLHPQSKNLIWSGRPTGTPDDFVGVVDWAVQRPASFQDIYFCLSLQAHMGRSKNGKPTVARSQADAMALRSIWLDIDIKDPPKGYTDLGEALKALDVFIKAYKLPFPTAIVASGGGMHVYWVSDRNLTPDEWRPYAEGLREAAVQHGLRCDGGVTIDSARILRVPGTFNYKIPGQPRPVAIKHLEPTDINFPSALAHLLTMAPSAPSTVTAAVTPGFDLSAFAAGPAKAFVAALGAGDNLAEGIEHNNDPLDPRPILAKDGCPYFRDAFATHGKDAGQGLWMLTVLASTFWQNGDTFAHELSNGHPGYKTEETDALIERKNRERAQRGLGWPSCVSFEREGCTQCKGCPHRGKIRSPLNLAIAPKPSQPNVVTPQQLTQASAGLSLPPGFAVDPKTGFICAVISTNVPGQSPVQELLPLFKCRISQPYASKEPDALHFVVSADLNNTREVCIPYKVMLVSTDLMRCFGDQMVKPNMPAASKLGDFFVSWVAELHRKQAAANTYPYGWAFNEGKIEGFAYGGVIARTDGTSSPAGHMDPQLRAKYTPCGSLQPWLDACKLITDQKRPALEIIAIASLAAPLIHFTSEKGANISAVGVSGANKTSAAEVGMAVWGNPLSTKETPESSAKAVERNIGKVRNLPIYWDEIKDEEAQHKAFSGVFAISEGAAGNKLNSDRSMRERGTWQTLMVISSNYNLGEFFINVKHASAASLYRIFEMHVEPANANTPGQIATFDAGRKFQELQYNFGNAGVIYSKYLVANVAAVDKKVHDEMEYFAQVTNQKKDERVWVAACGAIMTAADIANKTLGSQFNLNDVRDFLIKTFMENRDRASKEGSDVGNQQAAQDILTQFLKHYAQHTVFTHTMHNAGRAGKVIPIWPLPNPNAPPRAMHVHVAVSERVIRVSRKELYGYLRWQKKQPGHVIKMLTDYFGAQQKYATIAAGTDYKKGQEWVLEIPVPPGSPLEQDTLLAHEQEGTAPPPAVEVDTPRDPGDPLATAMDQAMEDLQTVRKAA